MVRKNQPLVTVRSESFTEVAEGETITTLLSAAVPIDDKEPTEHRGQPDHDDHDDDRNRNPHRSALRGCLRRRPGRYLLLLHNDPGGRHVVTWFKRSGRGRILTKVRPRFEPLSTELCSDLSR